MLLAVCASDAPITYQTLIILGCGPLGRTGMRRIPFQPFETLGVFKNRLPFFD